MLLTEADARRAGLAVLAGQTTRLGLSDLAQRVADGHAPRDPFLELEHGLRLVASAPRQVTRASAGAARRAASRCTLGPRPRRRRLRRRLDGGHAQSSTRPRTSSGRSPRAARPSRTPACSWQATRYRRPGGAAKSWSRSRSTAGRAPACEHSADSPATRCERLVLAPHSDALARGELSRASAALGRTLAGMGHVLRRPPVTRNSTRFSPPRSLVIGALTCAGAAALLIASLRRRGAAHRERRRSPAQPAARASTASSEHPTRRCESRCRMGGSPRRRCSAPWPSAGFQSLSARSSTSSSQPSSRSTRPPSASRSGHTASA